MTKIADIIAQRALAGDNTARARNKINNLIRANIIQPEAAPGERIAREFDIIENVLIHIAFDLEGPRVSDTILRVVLDDIRRQLRFGQAYESNEAWARATSRISVNDDRSDPETWQAAEQGFSSGLTYLLIESYGGVVRSKITKSPKAASSHSDWSVSVRLKSLRLLGEDMGTTVERQKDRIEPADLADETNANDAE